MKCILNCPANGTASHWQPHFNAQSEIVCPLSVDSFTFDFLGIITTIAQVKTAKLHAS